MKGRQPGIASEIDRIARQRIAAKTGPEESPRIFGSTPWSPTPIGSRKTPRRAVSSVSSLPPPAGPRQGRRVSL